MKALPTLLVCSLAVNVALVGVYLCRPEWVARTARSLHSPSTPATFVSAPTSAASARAATAKGIWSDLDESDISGSVARLRAMGIPERFARAIGRALIADKYRQKRNALLADVSPLPYWKSMGWRVVPKDLNPQLSQLTRAQAAEERALDLADGADPDVLTELYKKRQYGDLPKETVAKIEKIQADYADMQQAMYAEHPGGWTSDMAAKQAYLEKQKQADLAQTLTPDELETYQLHGSPVAQNVQMKLQYFDPTEAEYKAIFDAQQPVLAPTMMPRSTGMTADEVAQQQQMQAAADQQIAAALGPDRYAEYQMDTSPVYVLTAQALTPLDVPRATVEQVYSTAKTSQDEVLTIRNDPTLSETDKTSQISAVLAQASSSLSSLLGDQNFQAYKNQAGY